MISTLPQNLMDHSMTIFHRLKNGAWVQIFLSFMMVISGGTLLANPSSISYIGTTSPEPTLSGVVYDEAGEGLPGATIQIKGTNIGTISDIDGRFMLDMGTEKLPVTLVFSFVGYQQIEIQISEIRAVEVTLSPDIAALEEVVVVGYGTQKKRDVTGAVSSISGRAVDDLPLTSADQVIQGRMAGVQVVTSGSPGGYVAVRIRGTGTINNSDPLYVIDGFPVAGGISAINPDDIASIDVLKDASAAAIYGSRGANGVVIITTKRGKAGRTAVDISGYTGFQQVADPVEMLNASQYALLNNEARINGGEILNPAFSDPLTLKDSADWMDEIFRKGVIQNFTVAIRGGNENLRYHLSGGYLRQEGVIIGTGYDRKSFRLNLDHQAKDWLKVGNSLTYSLSTFQNDGGSGLVRGAMNSLPTQPVKRNGDFSGPLGIAEFDGDVTNPVGQASIHDYTDTKHRLLDNVFLSIEPLKWLTFRSELGVDIGFERTRNWSPKYKWGVKEQVESSLYEGSSERVDWLWDNTITFNLDVLNHRFKLLTGMSAQHSDFKFTGGSGQEFVSDIANQLDNVQSEDNVFGSTSEHALLSYIGRLNYDYKSKYLLTVTGRYDGSSRFGSNYRFGFFPSASAAWRLSEEAFLVNSSIFNEVKLRAGYGVTGNQNIGDFGYEALLNPSWRYSFGNTQVPAIVPQNIPNADKRWEQVVQSNIALDLMLFRGLIGMTVEYYIRDTEDMLIESPVPITTGFFDAQKPILNVGSVRNQGFEMALNLEKNVGGLVWNSDLNTSFNRNEILKLSGPNGDDPITFGGITFNKTAGRLAVGEPIGAFYGYVTSGIFQTAEEVDAHATQTAGTNTTNSTSPGDIRFKNLKDDDGVIDDEDRAFIGNPNPDVFYGWANSFSYKNFDLSIFIQGVYGNEIFNANRLFSEAMAVAQNQTVNTLNRWSGPGSSYEVPRATTTDPNNNQRVSDRYVEDGSYLRIKNLTFGYSLPNAILETLKIQKVRAYVSVQNLFTFTKYTGFDPEVGIGGIDNSVYPQSRIYTAGFNISL